MKYLVFFSLLAFPALALSQEFKPLPKTKHVETIDHDDEKPALEAGTHFEVASYDSKTKTYKLVLRADRTAGPLITTPEDLAKSVDNISLDKIIDKPYSVIRFDYKVADDKSLNLLEPDQIEARAQKKSKK